MGTNSAPLVADLFCFVMREICLVVTCWEKADLLALVCDVQL